MPWEQNEVSIFSYSSSIILSIYASIHPRYMHVPITTVSDCLANYLLPCKMEKYCCLHFTKWGTEAQRNKRQIPKAFNSLTNVAPESMSTLCTIQHRESWVKSNEASSGIETNIVVLTAWEHLAHMEHCSNILLASLVMFTWHGSGLTLVPLSSRWYCTLLVEFITTFYWLRIVSHRTDHLKIWVIVQCLCLNSKTTLPI